MKRFVPAAAASIVTGLALLAVATPAAAQRATGRFGEKSTIAVHVATGSPMLQHYRNVDVRTSTPEIGATPTLGFETTTRRGPDRECDGSGRCEQDRSSWTVFYLAPRLHYFVIDNLSIGGEFLLGFGGGTLTTRERDGRERERDIGVGTFFGVAPMIGYNVQISDSFSIWPQGGIGFRRFGYTDDRGTPVTTDDIDISHNVWFFTADVPFLLHLAPHFAIGAGPGLTVSFSDKWTYSDPRGGSVTTPNYGLTNIRWFNAHVIGWF
jgi:hypothetical protein